MEEQLSHYFPEQQDVTRLIALLTEANNYLPILFNQPCPKWFNYNNNGNAGMS